MKISNLENGRSVLASLRSLVPERGLRFSEALRIAELQAIRLLEHLGVEQVPVPNEVVTELPRIRVESRELPTSGLSYWDGQNWIIALNRSEPTARQRFTMFHEYKHIVDHGRVKSIYGEQGQKRAEQAADYFAGCLLVPRIHLKRAWAAGIQTPAALARHFEVSERAISVRLAQVGLTDERERCDVPSRSSWPQPRGRYFRLPSSHRSDHVEALAT